MNHVLIKAIDPDVEEEVTIEVDGIELVGFVSFCPYDIKVGMSYPVSIGITVLDELEIRELESPTKGFQRIEQGFVYLIRGILRPGGIIEAGIEIQDELLVDYAYLYNKFVEIRVDRISLSFE